MNDAVLFDENRAAIARSLVREPGEPYSGWDHARFLLHVQPQQPNATEGWLGIAQVRMLAHMVKQALDGVPNPVMVLGVDGFLEHANTAASAILVEEGLFRLRHGRVISVADDHRGWVAALRQLVFGAGCALPFTFVRGRTTRSGVIRLASLRENPSYAMVWPNATAVAAIHVNDPVQRDATLARLAARYRFTPTEVSVLQRLAEGYRPAEIAENLHLRISTVRTHLRNLFDKTGLRRQADLVRLISG